MELPEFAYHSCDELAKVIEARTEHTVCIEHTAAEECVHLAGKDRTYVQVLVTFISQSEGHKLYPYQMSRIALRE